MYVYVRETCVYRNGKWSTSLIIFRLQYAIKIKLKKKLKNKIPNENFKNKNNNNKQLGAKHITNIDANIIAFYSLQQKS